MRDGQQDPPCTALDPWRLVDGHAFVEEVLSYSHRYQPQQQTTTIPSALGLQDVAGTYLSTTTYLTDGSVNSRSMPAMGGLEREGVANTYDDWGNVVRVIGTASPSGTNTVYLDSAEYTPFGELQQRTLGRSTSPQALQTYQIGRAHV